MLIKETSVFTRQVERVLDRESYRLLQLHLAERPDAGSVMRGTGGLRKIRWSRAGQGKSGGVRVIYHWAVQEQVILMLLIYDKTVQPDLTPAQRTALRRIVEEEF